MFLESLLFFIVGVCIGSFLNVVIFRTKHGGSISNGRSKCQACEMPLGAKDLVPVFSYLALRGKCRGCKANISWQYPLVEIVTGLLFVITWLSFGSVENVDLQTLVLFVARDLILVSYLVVIFVYDLRYMLILDRFSLPAMILAIGFNLWLGIVPAWSMILGALVIGGFFLVQYVASKGKWVGGGDIRLGALMGLLLGLWHGLVALFLAYVIGGLVSVVLLWSGKVDRKTPIPFGTFLVVGTLATLFFGEWILDWYLSLFIG